MAKTETKRTAPGLGDASESPYPMHDVARCGCCGSERSRAAGRAQGLGLLRCRDCGTVRFEAVVDHDHIYQEGYHLGTTEFGWDFESERPYQLALADQTLAWLERRIPVGRMVDVGGGLGYFAGVAKLRGWDAHLLEPVAQACDFATKTFGVTAICACADALAERGERYELVTLIHSLEHFTNAREILDQVRAAVAPDGALYVEVPNFASAAHRLQGDAWYGLQVGQHVHHFTPRTLHRLLERAGYEVLTLETKVPGWDGLIPNAYAHWIGLERALNRALGLRRRWSAPPASQAVGTATRSWRPPVPVNQTTGLSRLVFARGFPLVARVEELCGLGTNLRLLARPRR